MAISEVYRSDKFRRTLYRGDALKMQWEAFQSFTADACGVATIGEPLQLAGYTLRVDARVIGTGRAVPFAAALTFEGTAVLPARFVVIATPTALGFAFEPGAEQAIDVRVEASRVDEVFTLLKGVVRLKDSASHGATP